LVRRYGRQLSWGIIILASGCISGTVEVEDQPKKPKPFEPVYVSNDIISCLIQAGRIRYVPDSKGRDYWQTPEETLEKGIGDCEDIAIYTHHLLLRKGIKAEVVVGLLGPNAKHGHCWVEYEQDGGRFIIEPKYSVILKRKNVPDFMYVPVLDIETVEKKFKRYHEKTGVWLNDRFRSRGAAK
jgi:hypothetical protein